MPTLVLPLPHTLPSVEIAFMAEGGHWQVEKSPDVRTLERLRQRRDVALYGDRLVVTNLARQLYIALLAPTLDWLPQLPEAYRQRGVRLLTWEEASKQTEPVVIKPLLASDYRTAFSQEEMWTADSREPKEPVLVEEPVSWDMVFRAFVRERHLECLALYSHQGQIVRSLASAKTAPADEQAAKDLVNQLLNDPAVPMPPALVLDVGRIAGRGWAVAAAGPVWCWARYFCDSRGVLKALQRACVSSFCLTEADWPWIVSSS